MPDPNDPTDDNLWDRCEKHGPFTLGPKLGGHFRATCPACERERVASVPPDRPITPADVAPAGYGTPLARELASWVERFALSREEADALWSVATEAQGPRPSKVHQAWVARKVGTRTFDAAVIALLRGAYIRACAANAPTEPRGFTSADTAPTTPAANETTRR